MLCCLDFSMPSAVLMAVTHLRRALGCLEDGSESKVDL